jgi:hypothetical protein
VKVLVFYQKLFVNLGCFFKVRPEVVQRRHAQLIFNCRGQASMQVHYLIFVAQLLGKLEENTIL